MPLLGQESAHMTFSAHEDAVGFMPTERANLVSYDMLELS